MPETDEFEVLAKSRRRRLILGVAGVLVAAAVILGVRELTKPGLPPLPADAAKVAEALPSLRREVPDLAALGGQALAELETQRLPDDLLKAFEDIGSVMPGQAGLVCAKGIAEGEGAKLFLSACPKGPDALVRWIESRDVEALPVACGDALDGLMSVVEARDGVPSCVALAATTWAYLKSKRAEESIERELLRMVALGK